MHRYRRSQYMCFPNASLRAALCGLQNVSQSSCVRKAHPGLVWVDVGLV